jgi:poly-beta-hydroxyalkanoate depolymerase
MIKDSNPLREPSMEKLTGTKNSKLCEIGSDFIVRNTRRYYKTDFNCDNSDHDSFTVG